MKRGRCIFQCLKFCCIVNSMISSLYPEKVTNTLTFQRHMWNIYIVKPPKMASGGKCKSQDGVKGILVIFPSEKCMFYFSFCSFSGCVGSIVCWLMLAIYGRSYGSFQHGNHTLQAITHSLEEDYENRAKFSLKKYLFKKKKCIYINAETILEYCIFRWERNNRPPLFRSADRKHRIFRGFIVKRTLASGPVLQQRARSSRCLGAVRLSEL